MKDLINIAIDGHSGCGKSTTARALAQRLGYIYIDTGAMYRAVALFLLENEVDWKDPHQLEEALEKVEVGFLAEEGSNRTILNGQDVEKRIRSLEISSIVSEVSALSPVRRKLVEEQQRMARNKGVVMDGRDIGTVVIPDAEVKFFMTADIDTRVRRRLEELQRKGIEGSFDEVKANLQERDRIDSSRTDSPLRMAEDAIVIDTTGMSIERQVDYALQVVSRTLKKSP